MIYNLTYEKIDKDDMPRDSKGTRIEIVEPKSVDKIQIRRLLSFTKLPDANTLRERAVELARIAERAHSKTGKALPVALISGPSFLISPLERELRTKDIWPVHPFYDEDGKMSCLVRGIRL